MQKNIFCNAFYYKCILKSGQYGLSYCSVYKRPNIYDVHIYNNIFLLLFENIDLVVSHKTHYLLPWVACHIQYKKNTNGQSNGNFNLNFRWKNHTYKVMFSPNNLVLMSVCVHM